MQPASSTNAQSLYDLLDLELPESLVQGKSHGQRIDLRDRLFVGVSIREVVGDRFGPARQYGLRDLSAGGMSISSTEPVAVGSLFEVEGCINHRSWIGRFQVVHCTRTAHDYKVGMKLVSRPEVAREPDVKRPTSLPSIMLPGQPSKQTHAEACLAQVEIDLDQVRNAFLTAENTWEQLGKTVRKLILKAADDLPQPVRQEPAGEADHRKHPRQPTSLDASMTVMGSQSWRRLPIHVNDVSEGGLGSEISKEQLDDPSAAKDAGECVLHAGLSVMMAFGAEPDTIWLPAEIMYCDYGRKDSVTIGVQFITPTALQFFGA